MSIIAKGPRSILVIERNSVPVKNIWDDIIDQNSLQCIQQRYNVSKEEIFECVDIFIDRYCANENHSNTLVLSINRTSEQRFSNIEATAINDKVYISILKKGHGLYPHLESFEEFFIHGLRMTVIEAMLNFIETGSEPAITNESFLHHIVYHALTAALEKEMDTETAQKLLEDLNHVAVLEELNNVQH
jgi:hypothetical protein